MQAENNRQKSWTFEGHYLQLVEGTNEKKEGAHRGVGEWQSGSTLYTCMKMTHDDIHYFV
jgi:hypothetical protein